MWDSRELGESEIIFKTWNWEAVFRYTRPNEGSDLSVGEVSHPVCETRYWIRNPALPR